MATHRYVKLCEKKGWDIENKTANEQMPRTVFIRIKRILTAFSSIGIAVAATPTLLNCSVGLSLWPRELDKPPWSWRRRRLFHSLRTLLVARIAKTSSTDHIFLCSPSVLREGTPLGKYLLASWLSQIWILRHALSERSLTPAMWHISSESVMFECWPNLSKLRNQSVYQILVYRSNLL